MALVSIFIPTYNQAEYLVQAVDSALEQDWPDTEVIVCDDASSDDTPRVLERFREHERVRLYRNPVNLGRVGNYRKCLYDLARGTWALNLDGDDYLIDSSYVSRAMGLIADDPAIDLVFANAYRRRDDIDGSLRKPDENAGLPHLIEGKELFLRVATEKISLDHVTSLYKVEKARNLDFYRADIISSDWESLFRYILTGRVAFISKCVAAWRIHGRNATRTMSVEDRIGNLQRIVGPYNEARSSGIFPDSIIDRWLEDMLFRQADVHVRDLIRAGDQAGHRQFLSEVDKISPRVCARIRRRPKVLWNRFKHGYIRRSR